jgi:hypothetical protein
VGRLQNRAEPDSYAGRGTEDSSKEGGREGGRGNEEEYEGTSKTFRTESITKYTLTTKKHSLRSNTKVYGGKTH